MSLEELSGQIHRMSRHQSLKGLLLAESSY
jgi:hypothetical protein